MSIWFHGSIKVRAFTDEALNRVKKAVLDDIGLKKAKLQKEIELLEEMLGKLRS